MLDEFLFLSVNFDEKKAISAIESIIHSKHHKEFRVEEQKIVFAPYWVFSFEAFLENEKREVAKNFSGKKMLHAVDGELVDVDFDAESGSFQEPQGIVFEKVSPKITKEHAKESAAIRVAAQLGAAKQNVLIVGPYPVYLPFWKIVVFVNDAHFDVLINAVNGELVGLQNLLEKRKNLADLLDETLQELKQPRAWVSYSKKAIKEISSLISKLLKTDLEQLAIILVILLILLFVFKII